MTDSDLAKIVSENLPLFGIDSHYRDKYPNPQEWPEFPSPDKYFISRDDMGTAETLCVICPVCARTQGDIRSFDERGYPAVIGLNRITFRRQIFVEEDGWKWLVHVSFCENCATLCINCTVDLINRRITSSFKDYDDYRELTAFVWYVDRSVES